MFQVSHKPSSVPQSGNDNLSKHGGQIHLPSRNWYIWSAPLAPNEACHRRMLPCGRVSSYLPDHIAMVGSLILTSQGDGTRFQPYCPDKSGLAVYFLLRYSQISQPAHFHERFALWCPDFPPLTLYAQFSCTA